MGFRSSDFHPGLSRFIFEKKIHRLVFFQHYIWIWQIRKFHRVQHFTFSSLGSLMSESAKDSLAEATLALGEDRETLNYTAPWAEKCSNQGFREWKKLCARSIDKIIGSAILDYITGSKYNYICLFEYVLYQRLLTDPFSVRWLTGSINFGLRNDKNISGDAKIDQCKYSIIFRRTSRPTTCSPTRSPFSPSHRCSRRERAACRRPSLRR